ncbi:MAG: DUF1614 domain-containing protein [Thaumarchaeota archaeon]|nr:DUF1614 domain-containing protein [Nitrososphaerota archaeon]
MSSYRFYRPYGRALYAVFAIILGLLIFFVFIGLSEAAFERIGLTKYQAVAILLATLLGSYINIPLRRIAREQSAVELDEVRVFWVTYQVPRYVTKEVSTVVAANLGGAIIPSAVCLYLLGSHLDLLAEAVFATVITATVVHMFARKVYGVGIVAPALVPPIVAALVAYLVSPGSPAVVAYVAGTLGTLIGADLTNLLGIENLGSPIASIGGAGKFDGIFLSGIIAVLLV